MQTEFAFDLKQSVKINLTGVVGVVRGLYVGRDGTKSAHVEYQQADGKIETRYFEEDEITAA